MALSDWLGHFRRVGSGWVEHGLSGSPVVHSFYAPLPTSPGLALCRNLETPDALAWPLLPETPQCGQRAGGHHGRHPTHPHLRLTTQPLLPILLISAMSFPCIVGHKAFLTAPASSDYSLSSSAPNSGSAHPSLSALMLLSPLCVFTWLPARSD